MVGFWDPGIPNPGAPFYEGAAQRAVDIVRRTVGQYGWDEKEVSDLLRDMQEQRPWYEGGRQIGGEGTGWGTVDDYFRDDPWRILDAFEIGPALRVAWRGTKYGAGAAYAVVEEYPRESYEAVHRIGANIAEQIVARWALKGVDVVVGKVPTGEYPEYTLKFWTRGTVPSGPRRGYWYKIGGSVPEHIDPIRTTSAQLMKELRRGVRFDSIDDVINMSKDIVTDLGKKAVDQVKEHARKEVEEVGNMAWFQRRRRNYGYNRGYSPGYGPRRRYRRYGSSSRYNYGRRPQYGSRRGYFRPRRWY